MLAGLFLSGGLISDVSARCSRETNRDPSSACYTGPMNGEDLRAIRFLARVEVTASRGDPFIGSQYWYLELQNQGIIPRAATVVEIAAGIVQIAGYVSPVLPKCAVTTTMNPIKTPDQDDRERWLLAKGAILTTFASNWNSVRLGQRVNVKYPSGDVVQFILTNVIQNPDLQGRGVEVSKFLDGIPRGGNAPCA